MKPIDFAVGTNSQRISSRLANTCSFKTEIPVTLPPGRFRLATNPRATGSKPVKKIMGIVVVRPSRQRLAGRQIQRSRPHDAEQDRRPAPRAGPPGCWPCDIQRLDCDPRHSPFRPSAVGLGENLAKLLACYGKERPQFAKPLAVLGPWAATQRHQGQ